MKRKSRTFRKGQKVRFTWGRFKHVGTIKGSTKRMPGKWKSGRKMIYEVKVWNPNFRHYNVYPISKSCLRPYRAKRRRK